MAIGERRRRRSAADRVIGAMNKVENDYREHYRDMQFKPVPNPGEPSSTYEWRLSAYHSRRQAFEKQGLSFRDPEKEIAGLQTKVLAEMLKTLPELQNTRSKLGK